MAITSCSLNPPRPSARRARSATTTARSRAAGASVRSPRRPPRSTLREQARLDGFARAVEREHLAPSTYRWRGVDMATLLGGQQVGDPADHPRGSVSLDSRCRDTSTTRRSRRSARSALTLTRSPTPGRHHLQRYAPGPAHHHPGSRPQRLEIDIIRSPLITSPFRPRCPTGSAWCPSSSPRAWSTTLPTLLGSRSRGERYAELAGAPNWNAHSRRDSQHQLASSDQRSLVVDRLGALDHAGRSLDPRGADTAPSRSSPDGSPGSCCWSMRSRRRRRTTTPYSGAGLDHGGADRLLARQGGRPPRDLAPRRSTPSHRLVSRSSAGATSTETAYWR